MDNRTITAPAGFLAAGIHAGIKESGRPDLGIIACSQGATAAAVFTTNTLASAPVQVSRRHVRGKRVFAVVVNSGNANACTGRGGLRDAQQMCRLAAQLANQQWPAKEVRPDQILVASTGIIGHRLPMGSVLAGIRNAWRRLSDSPSSGLAFAKAIMTTDTRPKQAYCRIKIGSSTITIAGAIKGAGMIGPNMATTLCFVTTDCRISKSLLGMALANAVDQTLNRLTVDGLQSTNDTAIIMASGLADNRPVRRKDRSYKTFFEALTQVCEDLVRQMALDAEGATRMFKVLVTGAATKVDAARAARAVADYPLVKCAVHGGDPNWGRIVCAVGSTGVRLAANRLSCRLDGICVFRNGSPCRFDTRAAGRIVRQRFHTIHVDLGSGRHSYYCYGVDLSKEYVRINAEYHT